MIGDLYFIFELFPFISCAYAYKSLDSNFKIFLPFLAFVVVYELINMFFLDLLLWHHSNAWCNNMGFILEFIVYGYFLASLDKREAYRKTVYIAVAAGIAIAIIDISFIHGFWALATWYIVSRAIILIVLISIYYYNLLRKVDNYPNLLSYPPFLITIGLLFYSFANLFFFGTFDYLLAKNNQHLFIIADFVNQISGGFVYSLLGIAFLCFSRTKKLS